MVLVGCAVMPHAPMVLQPDEDQVPSAARLPPAAPSCSCGPHQAAQGVRFQLAKTLTILRAHQVAHLSSLRAVHEACVALAAQIRERRPHTIVLITPHGVTLEQGLTGVYMNAWAKGSAEWSDGFGSMQVQCELDVLGSRALLKTLRDAAIRVKGVEFFGGGRAAAQLGWAEVVPLWFLDDILGISRFIIVSQGLSDGFAFGEKHGMTRAEAQSTLSTIAEMTKLGQVLGDWADSAANSGKRIFVIVSALLSHSHSGQGGQLNRNCCAQTDGTLAPQALLSPRYLSERTLEMRQHDTQEHDAAAQLFDKAVEFWLTSLRAEGLLVTARKVVPLAQPCSYSSFVILNGILDGKDSDLWVRDLMASSAPTNFGLCVASILPRWDRLPAEAMDTCVGHILLDVGSEYQLITLKCWFSDFGDFLDLHGELIVLPELPQSQSGINSPLKSQVSKTSKRSSKMGADEDRDNGEGEETDDQSESEEEEEDEEGEEAEEEDEEEEEDDWARILDEESRKHADEEARRFLLSEQERLKALKRPPTPPPTKAEKQMAQVADDVRGKILVVFAETLRHLHEQAVLAARRGAVGVIVVGGGQDARFTQDEFKVLRAGQVHEQEEARKETTSLLKGFGSAIGSGLKGFGRMLSTSSSKKVGPADTEANGSQNRAADDNLKTARAIDPVLDGFRRAPSVQSVRSAISERGGRVSADGRVPEIELPADKELLHSGILSLSGLRETIDRTSPRSGGKRSDQLSSPSRTPNVLNSAAASKVEGVSKYSFFKLPLPVVWVSAEDAVYFDDGHMVSIYWHDGVSAEDEMQPTARPEDSTGLATIQKRLNETDPDLHARQLSHLNLELRQQAAQLRQKDEKLASMQEQLSSALRQLKEASEENRKNVLRLERAVSPLASPVASSRGTRACQSNTRLITPYETAEADSDEFRRTENLSKRALDNALRLRSLFESWCAEAETGWEETNQEAEVKGADAGRWNGLGVETLAAFVLQSRIRRKITRLAYLGQLARLKRFATVVKPRGRLSFASTSAIGTHAQSHAVPTAFHGRPFHSGSLSPKADQWRQTAGTPAIRILWKAALLMWIQI